MFRAVSFDLFDTLVDLGAAHGPGSRGSLPALHAALEDRISIDLDAFGRVLKEVDGAQRVPRWAEGVEQTTDERFTAVLARLGIVDPSLVATLTRIHMEVIRSHVTPVAHHAALLRQLGGTLRLGLCSNFTHAPTARRILDDTGLAPALDVVVISADHGIRKPRPELFSVLLGGLDCAPAEVLHVGDNLDADVAGAAALGIRTAWITRRVRDPEHALASARGPRPDWIVGDLRELVAIVAP
jgi:FMN phosphatase YigB (HAD superfamily)